MTLRLLFAAGGTGGHIFPATAVADCCRRLHSDIHIEFVGTRGRLEEKVIPRSGYPLNFLWISGLEKLLSVKSLLLPVKLGVSFIQAWRMLGRLRIDCVICAGAYVSLPVGLAASIRRIPLVLMESNAYPGLAIRRLASRATEIHVAFDEAADHFPGSTVVASGNPVRQVFADIPDRATAARRLGLDPDSPIVFATGGSLGARSINKALDAILDRLRSANVQLVWQTGTSYAGGERREPGLYRTTFLNEMELGYAAADIVLARAGATTIAELRAVGRPSILVPLPIEKVRQMENATSMRDAGAAEMIRDDELDSRLLDVLTDLLENRLHLDEMGNAAKSMAVLDADERIARHVLALAEKHRTAKS